MAITTTSVSRNVSGVFVGFSASDMLDRVKSTSNVEMDEQLVDMMESFVDDRW